MDDSRDGQSGTGTTLSGNLADPVNRGVERLVQNIKSVIHIDTDKLEYMLASVIAGGHVILADAHGVGKTSLARALAGSIEWRGKDMHSDKSVEVDPFNRIQCTVDLLPQDILGYNRFLASSDEMIFNKGPIFAHFVLCDEINLLTPKAQGSFLEAMQEQAVTIEGTTFRLPDPFFIIATMNLKGAHLFPLPAPQLDRFMIQLSLGYPSAEAEADIIKRHSRVDAWNSFQPVVSSEDLLSWQAIVDEVTISADIVDYMVACLRRTRTHDDVDSGASPRTGVKLSRLSKALSLVRGQDYVDIDTVKELFLPAVAHRVVMKDPAQSNDELLREILDSVPVDPRKRAVRAGE